VPVVTSSAAARFSTLKSNEQLARLGSAASKEMVEYWENMFATASEITSKVLDRLGLSAVSPFFVKLSRSRRRFELHTRWKHEPLTFLAHHPETDIVTFVSLGKHGPERNARQPGANRCSLDFPDLSR
jgi:hypothetical protein